MAQATRLGFGSLEEVQADVARSCSEQARATTSLIFGPTMLTGQVKGTAYEGDACVLAVARHAFKLARAAVRERSLALGRVASSVMDVPGKLAAMAAADEAVLVVRQRAATTLMAACGDQFFSAYRMSVDTFLARLSARGDCVVADAFVVDAVRCPVPVCGNGVQEPLEECDDANLLDTDSCDASCHRTGGPPAGGETMGTTRSLGLTAR